MTFATVAPASVGVAGKTDDAADGWLVPTLSKNFVSVFAVHQRGFEWQLRICNDTFESELSFPPSCDFDVQSSEHVLSSTGEALPRALFDTVPAS